MTRSSPEQFIGELVGGRFVIERLIGQGPLSSAFLARDDLLQRRVTVKLFHPQHRDDVHVVDAQIETAKAVARLSHPTIVTIIDRGEHDGLPFIVFEHVRGENLRERIERFAPLGIGEVTGYGISIARALAYAHAQGVFHTNLRPENVLLSEEREVKLVDFGGGSEIASLGEADPFTAPELKMSASSQGAVQGAAQSDMYSLGALLFAALTSQPVVPDVDAARVQILRPDASPRLAATIARLLARSPEGRFDSMHDVASELSASKSKLARETGAPAGASGDNTSQATQAMAALTPPPRHRQERPRRRPERQRRARLFAWSMVIGPVVALVVLGAMLAGEIGRDQRSSDRAPGNNGPLKAATVSAVYSFDPEGDGGENDETIDALVDGTATSSWETEGYDTDRMGGLKSGVGFYFTLAEAAEVRELRFDTDMNGWTVQVYGADLPGKALTDWQLVSDPEVVVDGKRIAVDVDEHPYRHYLVWISRLALDGEKFRARAGEMTVRIPR